MSIEHKAYSFHDESFDAELRPIIERSLRSGLVNELVSFIEKNRCALKDPYEGNPLSAMWQELMETKDVHQYGDFALTKFYDPACDIGLGDDWASLEPLVPNSSRLLLGNPIGVADNWFDPGKMGSYFRSRGAVESDLAALDTYLNAHKHLAAHLQNLRRMLLQAAQDKLGLYVTF